MNEDLQSRLDLAVAIAREAGRSTLDFFRRVDLAVEQKSDLSPVTVADRQAEQMLRQRISSRFTTDGVLGEEFGETTGNSGYRWILDPIDGTKSFIRGVPLYGTLVAVEYGGRSLIGVIYIPALDECVYAAAGHGCWYERGNRPRESARVSSRASLAESLLSASETRFPPPRQEAYNRLQRASLVSRTWGDCYGYLLVATGRAEVMIDPIMHLWDVAALQPILEEAGGTLTDWQGRATIYSGDAIATNRLVLDEVLAITRGT
jgi:histidinol-phosphatase